MVVKETKLSQTGSCAGSWVCLLMFISMWFPRFVSVCSAFHVCGSSKYLVVYGIDTNKLAYKKLSIVTSHFNHMKRARKRHNSTIVKTVTTSGYLTFSFSQISTLSSTKAADRYGCLFLRVTWENCAASGTERPPLTRGVSLERTTTYINIIILILL